MELKKENTTSTIASFFHIDLEIKENKFCCTYDWAGTPCLKQAPYLKFI